MTCPECDGDPWFSCRYCGGTGGETRVCWCCLGKGEVACALCEGTGEWDIGDDEEERS